MLKKSLLIIALTTALVSAGFSQGGKPTPTPEAGKVNVRPEATPAAEPFDNASISDMASKCVQLDTELGAIEIELFPESAPETVRNILNVISLGMFDTTTFSRVVPGFVVQGGSIWTRDGMVTKPMGARARRVVPDEPNNILHERGVVSMARGDEAGTATTNFFILVSKADFLDGKFAAFGRVTSGMDVVDAINKAPVTDEKPEKPVRIKKASVITCQPAVTSLR